MIHTCQLLLPSGASYAHQVDFCYEFCLCFYSCIKPLQFQLLLCFSLLCLETKPRIFLSSELPLYLSETEGQGN